MTKIENDTQLNFSVEVLRQMLNLPYDAEINSIELHPQNSHIVNCHYSVAHESSVSKDVLTDEANFVLDY